MAWELRIKRDSPTAVVEKDETAFTITDGPNGECEVELDRADTVALDPGTYWHNLFRTDTAAETVLTYGDAYLGRGRRGA